MDNQRLRFVNSGIAKGFVAAIVVAAILFWLIGR